MPYTFLTRLLLFVVTDTHKISKTNLYLNIPLVNTLIYGLFINLPDRDELALDIVENLEAGLESFIAIIASLNKKN